MAKPFAFPDLFPDLEEEDSLMDARPGSVMDTVVEIPQFTQAAPVETTVAAPNIQPEPDKQDLFPDLFPDLETPAADSVPLIPEGLPLEQPEVQRGGATGTWEPFKSPGERTLQENITDKLKNFATGGTSMVSGVGGALRALGMEESGEKLNQVAREIETDYLQTVSQPTFADQVAAGFGSAATFFIPGFGVAKAANAIAFAPKLAKILGIGYAAVSESMVEAGTVYNEMKERGENDSDSRKAAAITFAGNLPLNIITDKWVFNKIGGSKLKALFSGASKEGGQEGLQLVISTVSKDDPILTKDFAKELGLNVAIGGIVGGTMAGGKIAIEKVTAPPAGPEAQIPTKPTAQPPAPSVVPTADNLFPDLEPGITPEGPAPVAPDETGTDIFKDVVKDIPAETDADLLGVPTVEEAPPAEAPAPTFGEQDEVVEEAPPAAAPAEAPEVEGVDNLTGLPNSNAIRKAMDENIAQEAKKEKPETMQLAIDIDKEYTKGRDVGRKEYVKASDIRRLQESAGRLSEEPEISESEWESIGGTLQKLEELRAKRTGAGRKGVPAEAKGAEKAPPGPAEAPAVQPITTGPLSKVTTPRLVENLKKINAKLSKQTKQDPALKKTADAIIGELGSRNVDYAGKPLKIKPVPAAKTAPVKAVHQTAVDAWQRKSAILDAVRMSSPESAKDYISAKDFGPDKYRVFWKAGQGTDVIKSVAAVLEARGELSTDEAAQKAIEEMPDFFLSDEYKSKPTVKKAVKEVEKQEIPEDEWERRENELFDKGVIKRLKTGAIVYTENDKPFYSRNDLTSSQKLVRLEEEAKRAEIPKKRDVAPAGDEGGADAKRVDRGGVREAGERDVAGQRARNNVSKLFDSLKEIPSLVDLQESEIEVVETPAEIASVLEMARDVMPGRDIVFVRPSARASVFGGVNVKGTIFINVNSKKPWLWVLFHEIFHSMQKRHPTTYNVFLSFIRENMTPEGLVAIRNRAVAESKSLMVKQVLMEMTPEQVIEAYEKLKNSEKNKGIDEITADLNADQMVSPEFLAKLHNESPALFRSYLKRIIDFFSRIITRIRAMAAEARPAWFKDFEKVRTDLARMLSTVMQAEKAANVEARIKAILPEISKEVKASMEGIGLLSRQGMIPGMEEGDTTREIERVKRERAEKERAEDRGVEGTPLFDKNVQDEMRTEQLGLFSRQEKFKPVDTNSPAFKEWFADSRVVDDNGKPLVVYSGHSNTTMYGSKYDPRKGTAGGFYASESPKVASGYAVGKWGTREYFENGDQYRLMGKGGKLNKKLWQYELSAEQKKKLDEAGEMRDENGETVYNIGNMKEWAKDNEKYDPLARRIIYQPYNLQNVWAFNEQMGYNISYDDRDVSSDQPGFMKQRKNDTEKILDLLGIEWNAADWQQPGVFPIYLNIKNPLDADKPFPADVLAKLKEKAKYERTYDWKQQKDWTKEFPLKPFISLIEEGSEGWSTQVPSKALDIFKRFGYDGVKERGQKGIDLPRSERGVNWIAFSPTQIKSATTNTGAFSPTDPDIRFSRQPLDDRIEQSMTEGPDAPAKKQKPVETPKSINPEVEKRMGDAKGVKNLRLATKLKENAKAIFHSFTRHYGQLDPKKYGQLSNKLREFEAISEYSEAASIHSMNRIVGNLDKSRYDVFTRMLILPDLMKDIDSGLYGERDLPFGYKDSGEIQQDIDALQKTVNSDVELQKALQRRKEFNDAIRAELVKQGLLKESVLEDDRYFHHQVLSKMAERQTIKAVSGDVRAHKAGFMRARVGSSQDYNTEYVEAEGEVIAQAIGRLETLRTLRDIKPLVDISDRLAEESKAENRKVPIPEGYVEWSPKPDTPFYPAKTIPEQLIEQLMNSEIKGISEEDIKVVLALGQKPKWVVTEEVAETMDNIRPKRPTSVLGRGVGASISGWKIWTLLNPFRIIKYNLNNTTGDVDVVIAGAPMAIKGLAGAAKDTFDYYVRKKPPNAEILEAIRRGVLGSGFTTQEVPDISRVDFFRAITGRKVGFVSKYWQGSKNLTEWRESILRLAAYRYYKQQMVKGKRPAGASKLVEVAQMPSGDELAAKLARELVGDYGNISEAGQTLRSYVMPFWSWVEINAPRYFRMIKNAAYEEGTGAGAKTAAKVGGIVAKKAAWKVAKTLVLMNILYGLVNLWNRLFFPDEEEELGNQRRQLHLLAGRNKDGSIRSIRFQGAFSDVLAFIDAEDYIDDFWDLVNKKATVGEKVKEGGISFLSRLYNSIGPQYKVLGELPAGKKLYPDVTKPRSIRDRWEYLASTLSLDKPYRTLRGRPTRGLVKTATSTLFYTSEPGENRYYEILSIARKFLDKHSVEKPGGFTPNKKSNALYYFKKGVMMGDSKAADKYLKEYIMLGGTLKGVEKSMETMDPINVVPKDYRLLFLKGLTGDERKAMVEAAKWHRKFKVAGAQQIINAFKGR